MVYQFFSQVMERVGNLSVFSSLMKTENDTKQALSAKLQPNYFNMQVCSIKYFMPIVIFRVIMKLVNVVCKSTISDFF